MKKSCPRCGFWDVMLIVPTDISELARKRYWAYCCQRCHIGWFEDKWSKSRNKLKRVKGKVVDWDGHPIIKNPEMFKEAK
jgi:rRNA maturation protein Nop10